MIRSFPARLPISSPESAPIGISFATGRPRLVITSPSGSTRSRIARHCSLNFAAGIVFNRFGSIKDPFGHQWSVATHVEDVPPEEMAERAKAAMAAMSSG